VRREQATIYTRMPEARAGEETGTIARDASSGAQQQEQSWRSCEYGYACRLADSFAQCGVSPFTTRTSCAWCAVVRVKLTVALDRACPAAAADSDRCSVELSSCCWVLKTVTSRDRPPDNTRTRRCARHVAALEETAAGESEDRERDAIRARWVHICLTHAPPGSLSVFSDEHLLRGLL
jgi:hypothetical protein